MIIIMQLGATKTQVANVAQNVKSMGLMPHIIEGQERTIVAIVGEDRTAMDRDVLSTLDGVERMMPVLAPYKIASREVHPTNTAIPLNGKTIGEQKLFVIAGPRLVDDSENFLMMAAALKEAGADALLGNVYEAESSPYSHPGLGEKGFEVLAKARQQTGLPIFTEVTEPRLVDQIAKVADVLVVSGHNMQNFSLLNAVGESQHTTLIKRGKFNTMEELLMAAEYVLARGNRQVILCQGAIRTTEAFTHDITFDVNAIPVLKTKTYLPILVDASWAAGFAPFIPAISKGAVASGADGLIIEVGAASGSNGHHQENHESQVLPIDEFSALLKSLRRVANAVDRTI